MCPIFRGFFGEYEKKIDLPRWGFEPRIFEQVPAHNLNFEED